MEKTDKEIIQDLETELSELASEHYKVCRWMLLVLLEEREKQRDVTASSGGKIILPQDLIV